MSSIYCTTYKCMRTAHGLIGERGRPLCQQCFGAQQGARDAAHELATLRTERDELRDFVELVAQTLGGWKPDSLDDFGLNVLFRKADRILSANEITTNKKKKG